MNKIKWEITLPVLFVLFAVVYYNFRWVPYFESRPKDVVSQNSDTIDDKDEFKANYEVTEELPEGLNWLTNEEDPEYSSTKAVKGGILRVRLPQFPLTFRTVGPDSNSSFRSYLLDNLWALVGIHPNTRNIIPRIATHWAFGDDKRSMYFKLNPNAKWSDGHPVTADDFLFNLEFKRSKKIVAPYYNDYFTKEVEKVVKYDDHTIGIFAPKPKPDLEQYLALTPRPKHFYEGSVPKDFVTKFNWEAEPTIGPYHLSEFRKGKYVILERTKDWWAENVRYYRNRFNVGKIKLKVIRDANVAWEYFKKGDLDSHNMLSTDEWFRRDDNPLYDNGYVHRTVYYTDSPRSNRGMYLNSDYELFKDRDIRVAFAHAINFELGIEKVMRGDVARLLRPYTGYGEYENEEVVARKFDIKRVGTIMRSKGWKRGSDGIWQKGPRRFAVRLTYGYAVYTDYLAFIKEEAKKAGLEIELENFDSSTAFKKILEKKHEVCFMAWSTTLTPSFWQGWHSDNAHKPQTNNISNTDNTELDRLIDTYRASTDREERVALSKQIIALIHREASLVPSHYFPFVRGAYWRWLRFPESGAATKLSEQELVKETDADYGGLFWIDPKRREETLDAKRSGKTFAPVLNIDKRNYRE